MLLESGEELSRATEPRLTAAGAPIALRLLEDAPPFREYQVFHVVAPLPPRRGLMLCRAAGGYTLRSAGETGDGALARVVAVEQRSSIFSVRRPPLRWLSPP